jgi:hypothetical protein
MFVLILLATFEEGTTIAPVDICPKYRHYSTLYYYDIRLYLRTERKCWASCLTGRVPVPPFELSGHYGRWQAVSWLG